MRGSPLSRPHLLAIRYGKLNLVNPMMRKALVQRFGLALAVYAAIIGFAASTSPRPPWVLFLSLFGAFLIFSVVMSLLTDRQLAVRTGRADAPWIGSCAGWTQTFSNTPIDTARHYATQAICNIGGRKVVLINDWEAVGWIGSSWVNVPEWQEYQLDVLISVAWGGETCFTCSARPRWKMVWGGVSKSGRLAESLQREVERLVHN